VHASAVLSAVSSDLEDDVATRLEVEGSGRTAGSPFLDGFSFGGEQMDSAQVIKLVQPLINDERMAKIERVIAHRTYTVLPVVEGLYNMGNLAAVRSAGGGSRVWRG
jgi:hypothetical protein